MKKIFITALMICFGVLAIGQQRPHYTQYVINPYIINPALTGIENYTDLKMAVRDQWVGINGAPKTVYLTVHAPIGKVMIMPLLLLHLKCPDKIQEDKPTGEIIRPQNLTTVSDCK